MTQPQLSILIPSIPSRAEKLQALLSRLQDLIGDKNIEVLCLIDNKTKSIGEKRDNLVQMSTGKYLMFIDDDDITHLNSVYSATYFDVDVISFQSECLNSNGSKYIVTHNLGNEVEHRCDENGNYLDMKRPPFHNCAWHNKFKKFHFPYVNYAEDWGWLKQFLPLAKKEHHLKEVIYKYNFNPLTTEACVESNSEWTNPNE